MRAERGAARGRGGVVRDEELPRPRHVVAVVTRVIASPAHSLPGPVSGGARAPRRRRRRRKRTIDGTARADRPGHTVGLGHNVDAVVHAGKSDRRTGSPRTKQLIAARGVGPRRACDAPSRSPRYASASTMRAARAGPSARWRDEVPFLGARAPRWSSGVHRSAHPSGASSESRSSVTRQARPGLGERRRRSRPSSRWPKRPSVSSAAKHWQWRRAGSRRGMQIGRN